MTPTAPITAPTMAGPSVLDEAHAPASVRNGSAAVKQAYASAQGFEEMLLQQLSSSLVQSSGLSGEGESAGDGSGEAGSPEGGGEAGDSMLSSLLPQTLTEGVMREGGLGLAAQLMSSLDRSASTGAVDASAAVGPAGGVSAGSSIASAPAGVVHGGGASA